MSWECCGVDDLERERQAFDVLDKAAEQMCLAFAAAHQAHHDDESRGWQLNSAWVDLNNARKQAQAIREKGNS